MLLPQLFTVPARHSPPNLPRKRGLGFPPPPHVGRIEVVRDLAY